MDEGLVEISGPVYYMLYVIWVVFFLPGFDFLLMILILLFIDYIIKFQYRFVKKPLIWGTLAYHLSKGDGKSQLNLKNSDSIALI